MAELVSKLAVSIETTILTSQGLIYFICAYTGDFPLLSPYACWTCLGKWIFKIDPDVVSASLPFTLQYSSLHFQFALLMFLLPEQ